jgi:hypothetical protein
MATTSMASGMSMGSSIIGVHPPFQYIIDPPPPATTQTLPAGRAADPPQADRRVPFSAAANTCR